MFSLSSSSRITGTSADFKINAPPSYFQDIKKVELEQVTMPNTIYNITSANNHMDINDGALKVVTIPDGAYTISVLCSTLLTQLNVVSTNFTAVTYSPTTFKVTITRTVNFSILFSTGVNVSTAINEELGFAASDFAGASTYTGAYPISLGNPYNIYIRIDEVGSPGVTSSNVSYTFVVPMVASGGAGSILNYTVGNFYKQQVNLSATKSFSQFSIKLLDGSGNPVNLNTSDWEMIMRFSQ
jgi:hypothetical protein